MVIVIATGYLKRLILSLAAWLDLFLMNSSSVVVLLTPSVSRQPALTQSLL